MCYDAQTAARKSLQYAIYSCTDPDERAALKRKLDQLLGIQLQAYYHVSGFAHPKVLVFTDKDPSEPQAFYWGLIPAWVKDEATAKTIVNQTLNARGETIFEKPSFKNSAKNKRCLVYLDAFYEHHHFGGKTYPYKIFMKNNDPVVVAGLWEEWVNKNTGEIIPTFTIVTTTGNKTMAKIHNNPKADGPRMPVILNKEDQKKWLKPILNENDQKEIEALIKPCEDELLQYHTVNKLKGKAYIGNVPEIDQPFVYKELLSESN